MRKIEEFSPQYLLRDSLPADHSAQATAFSCAKAHWRADYADVLDLGCGEGNSIDFFRNLDTKVRWTGLDIADSIEVAGRNRRDATFVEFDGMNIPFGEKSFDVVFCRQVLEHVREPSSLLAEVQRVIKKNGLFIGSLSQLEPLHSCSVLNWTAFGIKMLFEKAGLRVLELRPGIDGLTLLLWYLTRGKMFGGYFSKESPLNRLLSLYGRMRGKKNADINAFKLIYAGHICFVARKK